MRAELKENKRKKKEINKDNSTILAEESENNTMNNNSIVTTEYNGEILTLVYNESFLMLSRNGFINIALPQAINRWVIRMNFLEPPNVAGNTSEKNISGNNILYTFFHFNGDGGIEWSTADYIDATDNSFRIYIKMKTFANTSQNNRTVHVTIWLR